MAVATSRHRRRRHSSAANRVPKRDQTCGGGVFTRARLFESTRAALGVAAARHSPPLAAHAPRSCRHLLLLVAAHRRTAVGSHPRDFRRSLLLLVVVVAIDAIRLSIFMFFDFRLCVVFVCRDCHLELYKTKSCVTIILVVLDHDSDRVVAIVVQINDRRRAPNFESKLRAESLRRTQRATTTCSVGQAAIAVGFLFACEHDTITTALRSSTLMTTTRT